MYISQYQLLLPFISLHNISCYYLEFHLYNISCYYLEFHFRISAVINLSSICTTSVVITLSFISQYQLLLPWVPFVLHQLLLPWVSFHNITCYYLEFYFTTSAVFIFEFHCTIERLRFPTCTCTGITSITKISCILHHQFLPLKDFYTFS